MKTCPICGNEIEELDDICLNCYDSDENSSDIKENKKIGLFILLILLLMLMLLAPLIYILYP